MTDHRNINDSQHILDIAAGVESALEAIYDRYAQRIYSLAMSILKDQGLAEDAVQDVFANLWLKATSYRPREIGAQYLDYVSSASQNRGPVSFRRRTFDATVPDEDDAMARIPDPALSVEQQVERSYNARLLRAALAELPPEQAGRFTCPPGTDTVNRRSPNCWINHWEPSRHECVWACKN